MAAEEEEVVERAGDDTDPSLARRCTKLLLRGHPLPAAPRRAPPPTRKKVRVETKNVESSPLYLIAWPITSE